MHGENNLLFISQKNIGKITGESIRYKYFLFLFCMFFITESISLSSTDQKKTKENEDLKFNIIYLQTEITTKPRGSWNALS